MPHTMMNELRQTKPFAGPQVELYLSLARTVDTLRRQVEAFLKTQGLSEAQYNVLRILNGSHPTGLSCGEIGARMVTRDPDVTRLLDRLEQNGLVERKRGASDRRVVSADITSLGMERVKSLDQPLLELTQRQLGFLGAVEIEDLLAQLVRIRRQSASTLPASDGIEAAD